METIFEDRMFTKETLPDNILAKGAYEHCHFVQLDLNGVDLSHFRFTDCVFENCNLSLCKLAQTCFNKVKFEHCRLTGLRFEDCYSVVFGVSFYHSQLDMSTFYGCKIKKTVFESCSIKEVDFTNADLGGAVFRDCDLHRSVFVSTILEKTDFSTAVNFQIDPQKNRIKKAVFSSQNLSGLLTGFDLDIR